MEQQLSADLAIVGAGVVGSALALAAAINQPTIRIVLVDSDGLQAPVNPSDAHYDPRVVALNHRSIEYLKTLGAWSEAVGARACPYKHMSVWDGEGTAQIDFSAAELHRDCLGVIAENNLVVGALHARLRELDNLVVVPASLVGLEPFAQGSRLALSDGSRLNAKLTVGADGANSKVRALAGFDSRQWPYAQSAIVTRVQSTLPHGDTAWQRFTDSGPLAFLPLAGHDDRYCSIVWSLETDRAREIAALDDGAFCKALGRAFEHKLGEVLGCDKRYELPLRQMHVTHYYQPRVVLAGDAAHTIHPLAGQGVNLGLRDVAVLAEELDRAGRRALSLSEPATLRRYQRRVQAYNLSAMAAMEAFSWLFVGRQPRWRILRNMGMTSVDRAPPVKRELMLLAAGDRFF